MGRVLVRLVVVVFSVIFSMPALVYSIDDSVMRFVAKKDTETGRMFLFRCNMTHNIVEVEQRYNRETGFEDVRFIVNNQSQDWITGDLIRAQWKATSAEACESSKVKYVVGTLK